MKKYVEEVKSMEEFKHNLDTVNKKIDNIEYKEIKELRNEIQSIKLDLVKNNVLTERLESTLSKMSSTMENTTEVLFQLSKSNEEVTINLKQTNEKIDNMQEKQNKSDEDFENIRQQIDEYNNKSKFDIMLYLKNNFINIVAWAGIIAWTVLRS